MALSYADYGKAITMYGWGITEEHRQCWWLVKDKLCQKPMVPMINKMAWICEKGHETPQHELNERKYG
jgi:hypothetical protein